MKLIQRVAANATAEQVAAIVKVDGACIVEDLVDPALLDQIAREVQPYVANTPAGNLDYAGFQTRRTGGLAGRSPGAGTLIMNPLIVSVGRLILAKASSMQINNTEIISMGPGETLQPLHRDHQVWAEGLTVPPGYELEFSVMWPITDFTTENGATRLVLGSHLTTRKDIIPESETQQATMRKGSVLIFTGSIYHGGGENRTNAVRQAVNIAYCLGWLRQEENQYLAVERHVAATLNKDLLGMMGYERCGPALGNGVDRSDPMGIFYPELARPGYIDPKFLLEEDPSLATDGEIKAH